MFLKNKKGDITLQQVVLIVLAVAMIFIVLSFGSKIWQSFFPSADKSTSDSFNTLYNVINSKTFTDKSYDMTPITSYIGDDYCIIYFYSSGDRISNSEDGTIFYKPTICKGEPCLCLYDDVYEVTDPYPGDEIEEKDEDIINCKPIKYPVNIDDAYYDFKGAICGDEKTYSNYLIIKRDVKEKGSSVNKPYVYILKDSDEKRADGKTARELHNTWNVPRCQGASGEICLEKNAGEVLYPKTDQDFDKFYNECNLKSDKHYASISITCEYDASKRTCQPDCIEGDVLDECKTTYKTCDGYNQVLGVDKYITTNIESEDYKYYYMCKNDVKYCGAQDSNNRPNGCSIDLIDIYARKYSDPDGSLIDTESDPNYNPEISGAVLEEELSTILNSQIREECKIKTISIPLKSNNVFLESYDESIENCKTHINTYFYEQKSTVMGCREGNSVSCNEFIEEIKSNDFKSLKYIQNPLSKEIFWITYYDNSKISDTEINLRFEPISRCVNFQVEPQ